MDVDGAFVAIEVEPPNALENRFARERDARVCCKRYQKFELTRLQSDTLSVDAHLARGLVDLQPSHGHDRRRAPDGPADAPRDRFHPSDEFARRERLDHIIIDAEFKGHDAIDFITACRQHDDRQLHTVATEHTRNVETIDRRKARVEHEHIDGTTTKRQRQISVGDAVDVETGRPEMVYHEFANGGVVFGDQHLERWHRAFGARSYWIEGHGYDAAVVDKRKEPEDDQSGNIVQLTADEEREVRKRSSLRAAVVFETVRREGESEARRPVLALLFSGLACGLSMGFSLVGTGVLRASIPPEPWRPLVVNLGYPLGFLIVVLGRQQLFTENTLTAILPVFDDPETGKKLIQMLRLWGLVLFSNLIGAGIFAYVIAHTATFPPNVKSAFLAIGLEALKPTWGEIVWRGLLAGWLIALMVWLIPAANSQRLWVIIIITWLVGAAGLSHIIAGSVEALYAVAAGAWPWPRYLADFLAPVFIGNCIGGVGLVAMLNYGQVAPQSPE